MKFTDYVNKLHRHFEEMTKDVTQLFEVEVDKDELWNTYLESFAQEFNPVFRERRTHDCSCCRGFIKGVGNMVVIKDNQIITLWDFRTDDEEYQPVLDAMSSFIKSKDVTNIYVTKDKKIGIEKNNELLENGKVITWNHLFLEVPQIYVDNSHRSEGDIKGTFRDVRNVFKRSLDEISVDSVETVLELILSNTLYKGAEWKAQLQEFLKYKKEYMQLDELLKDNYAWEQSVKVGTVIGKIRNHSIGTLLVNVSEGMDLDTAVKKYEAIVAPSNYKRPKAIFTKKMLEDAKKTITELGYMDSLQRRYATLDDITVNNILFSNKDSAKRIGGMDIFDEMSQEVVVNPKKFSKVEEIHIDKFLSDVLPTAKEVEVLLENKHSNNMVSLIAPEITDSKTMLKWDNNFSWAYSGNITDSSMAERVEKAGGRTDGVLRFSIQWNDRDSYDNVDLDAHCHTPEGGHIYFSRSVDSRTRGNLDVDITGCSEKQIPVENITFPKLSKMGDGKYKFRVHNYSRNSIAKSGFRAEIAFNGEVYEFDYANATKSNGYIDVAEVSLKDGQFTIKELLPSTTSLIKVWGLSTNQFIPVSTVMFSPNYWNEQEGIGHKHVFFMLKDCVNSESPNGFYNEFLKQDLMKHKRVFEALGGKMAVKDVEDQLSGVGFSTTKRSEVIVKVTGKTQRTMKVKF